MEGICRNSSKDFGIRGVEMEEYLKILSEQIRYKKALPEIEEEIRCHIQDQAEANRLDGMTEEEAVSFAVKEMGDPVEAGVKLDRIHRPQMARAFIVFMAVVSVISAAVHIGIGLGAEEIGQQASKSYMLSAVLYIGIGFLVMLFVYRLDYSILAGRERLSAMFFLAVMTVEILWIGIRVNGARIYGSCMVLGSIHISLVYLMYLYVPLYGAVLYHYRGHGWKGFGMSVIFLMYPVWLALQMPSVSLALLLLLTLSVMLTLAVWKNWFIIPKKIVLGVYWGILVLFPIVLLFLSVKSTNLILAPYQQARIQAFYSNGGMKNSYVDKMILENIENCRLFGAGGIQMEGILPNYNSDYILAFLSGCYGLTAAFVLCLFAGGAAVKIFRISFGQKNQLGMMMGFGCGLVLFANTLLNIGANFGILPVSATFLPFFSYTGTGMIVSYFLVGIVLSVYRYKNLNIKYFTVSKTNISVD